MMFLLSAAVVLGADVEDVPYPIPLDEYPEAETLWKTLCERVKIEPFNLYATVIFLCAVVHTFCHKFFVDISELIKNKSKSSGIAYLDSASEQARDIYSKIFHLLGEVELIFAFWLIPLLGGFWYKFGGIALSAFLDNMAYVDRKYEEPLFVMVIMLISASKPIVDSAAWLIKRVADLGGGRGVVDFDYVHRSDTRVVHHRACGNHDFGDAADGEILRVLAVAAA